MPDISIFIPAYNASAYLAETIRSAVGQTFPDWELVVVDDGSTDDTYDVAMAAAAGDPRIKVVQQKNTGMGGARNTGYANCSKESRFVASMDADDVWQPQAFALLRDALLANPSVSAAHGDSFRIGSSGQRIEEGPDEHSPLGRRVVFSVEGKPRELLTDENTTLSALLSWNFISTPGCVLMRRSVFDQIGGFRPDVRLIGDWHMWIALAMIAPIAYVHHDVLAYRRHESNISHHVAELSLEVRKLRTEVLAKPHLTPGERACVVFGGRSMEAQFARDKVRYMMSSLRRGDVVGAATQAKYGAGHVFRLLTDQYQTR
jgi:glycosyltransferase involved in cell wall biosynthesis